MFGGLENRRNLLHDMFVIKKVHDLLLEEIGGKYGLTKVETCVLAFLASNQGMDTARDISEYLMITKSHVSKAVEGLSGKGYISGDKSCMDRRQVHLRLTQKANAIALDINRRQTELIEALDKGIGEADYEKLCEICGAIARSAEEFMKSEMQRGKVTAE